MQNKEKNNKRSVKDVPRGTQEKLIERNNAKVKRNSVYNVEGKMEIIKYSSVKLCKFTLLKEEFSHICDRKGRGNRPVGSQTDRYLYVGTR